MSHPGTGNVSQSHPALSSSLSVLPIASLTPLCPAMEPIIAAALGILFCAEFVASSHALQFGFGIHRACEW